MKAKAIFEDENIIVLAIRGSLKAGNKTQCDRSVKVEYFNKHTGKTCVKTGEQGYDYKFRMENRYKMKAVKINGKSKVVHFEPEEEFDVDVELKMW